MAHSPDQLTVDVAGERRKAWMFLMRLMFSKRDFAWLYDGCTQLAFLDGHVRAFAHFGAVPNRAIYDNLKAAVKKVVLGGRDLTEPMKSIGKECQNSRIRLTNLTNRSFLTYPWRMTNVNIYEAKSRLSHLLRLVAEGEEVIISKSGQPIARLVPFVASPRRQPGRLQGRGRVPASFFEPLPDDLQAYFE